MTRLATFQACDQVADAGAGKLAFIGIYSSDLLVPQIPFSLAQLYFVVRFRTPINDRPKKVAVRIERPGHPPFRIDHTPSLNEAVVPEGAGANFFQLQVIAVIQPFEIKEAGTVKVFVEDEIGDNYAGGLRLKAGVVPNEANLAGAAGLIAAQYERVSDASHQDRCELAEQLLSSLVSYMRYSSMPPKLQYPDRDVRLLLDERRVHVFFPQPTATIDKVRIEDGENFDSATVEAVDKFGFIVAFEPRAPTDLNFSYVLADSPRPRRKKAAKDKS